MSANILVFIKLCVKKIYESESIQNLVILFIVCVTVILICGTVLIISTNEACLRRKKLNMLKSVLSGGVLTTDDIYKTFADAVSEV